MLIRVDADTFEAPAGATIRIIAKQRNGPGSATFRYRTGLATLTINGHPGCLFKVAESVVMFSCAVVFGPDGDPYDLFEVEADGTETDLEIELTPAKGPSIQFRLSGLPVAALASAPRRTPGRRRAKKRAPQKAARRKATKRKTATRKSGRKKTTAKKAARRKTGGGRKRSRSRR